MANNGSASAIVSARPAIVVDGQDNSTLTQGLVNLMAAETCQGLYRCEASVGNWGEKDGNLDYLFFDRDTLDFGKAWQVKFATNGEAQTVFDGYVTGLEAHFPTGRRPTIVVLAEDRLQDLRMTRRTRSFEQVSDADVMQQIARDHGLTPEVQVDGPTYRVLAQVNQSDLAFLRDRARTIDADLWVEGNTMYARSHSQREGGTVTLTYPGTLRTFSVLADLAHQRTSVAVSGWDVSAKQGLQYEATDRVLGGELNGDESGARILSAAFGERKDALVHTVPLSSSEAQATAEAAFKAGSRRFLTGHGVADPNAQLRVGSRVDLRGLGPLFSGRYFVTRVQHLFDSARGLRTEFEVERPGLGRTS